MPTWKEVVLIVVFGLMLFCSGFYWGYNDGEKVGYSKSVDTTDRLSTFDACKAWLGCQGECEITLYPDIKPYPYLIAKCLNNKD